MALLRLQRGLACAAAALALVACSTLQPPADTSGTVLQGRLALRVAASGTQPARSETTAFELQGDGDRGDLRLSTPLGTQLARARWAPGRAELETAQGRNTFADLAELSQQALGEALPLQALSDWLQGRAWPGAPHRVEGDRLLQLGWRLDFTRLAAGVIAAERDAPPAITLRVQLER